MSYNNNDDNWGNTNNTSKYNKRVDAENNSGSNNGSTNWRDEPKSGSPSFNFGRSNGGYNRSYNNNNRYGSYSNRNSTYEKPQSIYANGSSDWKDREFEKRDPIQNFEKKFSHKYLKNIDPNYDASQYMRDHEIELINCSTQPVLSFDQLQLPNNINIFFDKKNITTPTPIQAFGWPIALNGGDMVGIAQTGSGKSLSFIIPALIHLAENHRNGADSVALVLAPTRELIVQIAEVVGELADRYNVRTALLYGGVSHFKQRKDLTSGATFICATPGRLLDLSSQGVVPLERVTYLVLDEADRMLDMGFEPQLRKIVELLPKNRQTLMWSATWPLAVQDLAKTYMQDYSQIRIGGNDLVSNKKIDQDIIITNERQKFDLLDNFITNNDSDKIIVFSNKKRTCDDIEQHLNSNRNNNCRAGSLHGDKQQMTRDRIINDFKTNRINVLIATDVAARGIDISDISKVLNFDMPNNCEQYVHRIGRTGRGGKTGHATTFFTENDAGTARELISILHKTKQNIPQDLQELARFSGGNKSNSSFGRRRYHGGSSFGNKRRW